MRTVASDEAYPLAWPDGRPRTKGRERARFDTSLGVARDHLIDELRKLGSRYIIISSNLPVKRDGFPYANAREPDDPGVAVYFDLGGGQTCIACDRWDSVRDNVHAIGKTVDALRGIERWGSSEMMNRAFSAFQALPPAETDWRSVFALGSDPTVRWTLDQVRTVYRARARQAHPDSGGSHEEMAKVNAAMEAAERELS